VGELRPNSNLADAWADGGHRLRVVRIQSVLHLPQLKAAAAPCICGKGADVATRRPEPGERLVRHVVLYKFLYKVSNRRRRAVGIGFPGVPVLARGTCPRNARRRGSAKLAGWRRPTVINNSRSWAGGALQ
jgi:hypothetical protein